MKVTPVYNKDTGRLEQLTADRNGTGKVDTRAYMDGTTVKKVEVDRHAKGRPDRWEYYEADGATTKGPRTVLVRAEEANGPDDKITRWERYERGALVSVDEDTDFDGRVDKWEHYAAGALLWMDLDLTGRGFPDRRMIYGAGGTLDHMESDPTGDGRFKTPPAGLKKGGD